MENLRNSILIKVSVLLLKMKLKLGIFENKNSDDFFLFFIKELFKIQNFPKRKLIFFILKFQY